MTKIYVVKIGGNIIKNDKMLDLALRYFCRIKEYKILVHGGGGKADFFLKKMGFYKKKIQGRRITDKNTLNIVVMTYAGIINKNIVSILQKYSCNAMGLSGADGNCIKSFIRKKNPIDYGYVGDIFNKGINVDLIKLLLENDIVPVLCSITHDKMGNLLNTNADTIASNVAVSLSSKKNNFLVKLHFSFEKNGVFNKKKNPNFYYEKIDFNLFHKLKKDFIIKNGMIPKLENAFFALQNGVYKVSIGSPIYSYNDFKKKTVLCLN